MVPAVKPILPSLAILALTASGALALLGLTSCSTATAPSQGKLAPGQYEWHPERSPGGPLLMVVSIDDQMAYVYRNGVQIARSTVSTGKPGKETPTGVFTILQRKVEHESSIYVGAQMPYMQRLTWSGIAMHAGELPGYPASGGCIRLPYAFSQKVYGAMRNGSTVVITKKGTQPSPEKGQPPGHPRQHPRHHPRIQQRQHLLGPQLLHHRPGVVIPPPCRAGYPSRPSRQTPAPPSPGGPGG